MLWPKFRIAWMSSSSSIVPLESRSMLKKAALPAARSVSDNRLTKLGFQPEVHFTRSSAPPLKLFPSGRLSFEGVSPACGFFGGDTTFPAEPWALPVGIPPAIKQGAPLPPSLPPSLSPSLSLALSPLSSLCGGEQSSPWAPSGPHGPTRDPSRPPVFPPPSSPCGEAPRLRRIPLRPRSRGATASPLASASLSLPLSPPSRARRCSRPRSGRRSESRLETSSSSEAASSSRLSAWWERQRVERARWRSRPTPAPPSASPRATTWWWAARPSRARRSALRSASSLNQPLASTATDSSHSARASRGCAGR
mmetsp:Transcript_83860/g.115773  ORF Transcript_83860/g.115773 Transcript_83860/m.115773 type:complete len:309 (-) Transcript_83860:2251-3177(-)